MRIDGDVARLAFAQVSALLDAAIKDQAHPERVQALREAVDCIAVARTAANRAVRERYRRSDAGKRKNRQRAAKGRIRRNDRTIDAATNRKQPWTDHEVRVLERAELTHMQCAEMLGRTLRGVARKRETLGIITNQSGDVASRQALSSTEKGGRQWTGPELEVVARDDLSVRDKAEMLGRTMNAIHSVTRRLRVDPRMAKLAGLPASDARDATSPEQDRRVAERPTNGSVS